MTISGNYSSPVTVNGFQCKNCTDVDNAKKHIDPQHPKSGPYGVNAKNDPTVRNSPSVAFDGSLKALNSLQATRAVTSASSSSGQPNPPATGALLDLSV